MRLRNNKAYFNIDYAYKLTLRLAIMYWISVFMLTSQKHYVVKEYSSYIDISVPYTLLSSVYCTFCKLCFKVQQSNFEIVGNDSTLTEKGLQLNASQLTSKNYALYKRVLILIYFRDFFSG